MYLTYFIIDIDQESAREKGTEYGDMVKIRDAELSVCKDSISAKDGEVRRLSDELGIKNTDLEKLSAALDSMERTVALLSDRSASRESEMHAMRVQRDGLKVKLDKVKVKLAKAMETNASRRNTLGSGIVSLPSVEALQRSVHPDYKYRHIMFAFKGAGIDLSVYERGRILGMHMIEQGALSVSDGQALRYCSMVLDRNHGRRLVNIPTVIDEYNDTAVGDWKAMLVRLESDSGEVLPLFFIPPINVCNAIECKMAEDRVGRSTEYQIWMSSGLLSGNFRRDLSSTDAQQPGAGEVPPSARA